MNAFDDLLNCSGNWKDSSRLQAASGEPVHESLSRIVVTPMLRDTFLRLDQTWTWRNQPQVGAMLIGYDRESEKASLHWVDTFHNGKKVMACAGGFDPLGKLIVHGSYAAPPGPDWGWRIEIPRVSDREIRIDMFNVDLSDNEEGGVWARFIRE